MSRYSFEENSFSVDYSPTNQFDILNIQNDLMVMNNMKQCLNLLFAVAYCLIALSSLSRSLAK